MNSIRKPKELFQISLEKKREAIGRGLPMAIPIENQDGRLKIPKVIREVQVMVIKIPKQSLKMVKIKMKPGRSC